MRKLIKLVSTHHSCPQRRWRKMTLNKVTRKFIWPMPKVEDIFSKLNGTNYFLTLDLWAGYHHIPLDKSSIPKTAFTSPFGKYEYIKVPFGLTQAPAYFQEVMTGILKDFNFAIAYLDNIIIFSRIAEEHLNHIKQDFEKLRNAHLSMKLSKCHFFTKEIQHLGYIFSTKGIRPLPSKIQAIKTCIHWKQPNKYVHFLDLSDIIEIYQEPCQDGQAFDTLNSQQAKFEWMLTHHTTFLTLKESVIQVPILHYLDPMKHYIVYSDTSDDARRAQLSQEHDE